MSAVMPVRTASASETSAVSSESSLTPLIERLSAEIDAAERRVHSLQTEAAKSLVDQGQQLARFNAVADRIAAILRPRLEALMNLSVFSDIHYSESLELPGLEGRGGHARMTTLSVPCSDKRPAAMELSFHVGHDHPINNVVIDYRLEILPIFVQFKSHQQLAIPIEDPKVEMISPWIDENLVGFTKTYFEVYFHKEYQKKTLETDPVLNIRFPRAFAAGKTEYQTRTYHFYTAESLELFEKEPANYIMSPDKAT